MYLVQVENEEEGEKNTKDTRNELIVTFEVKEKDKLKKRKKTVHRGLDTQKDWLFILEMKRERKREKEKRRYSTGPGRELLFPLPLLSVSLLHQGSRCDLWSKCNVARERERGRKTFA